MWYICILSWRKSVVLRTESLQTDLISILSKWEFSWSVQQIELETKLNVRAFQLDLTSETWLINKRIIHTKGVAVGSVLVFLPGDISVWVEIVSKPLPVHIIIDPSILSVFDPPFHLISGHKAVVILVNPFYNLTVDRKRKWMLWRMFSSEELIEM